MAEHKANGSMQCPRTKQFGIQNTLGAWCPFERVIGDQVTKVEGYWGPSDQSGGLLGIIPKVVGLLGVKLASWRVIGAFEKSFVGYSNNLFQ